MSGRDCWGRGAVVGSVLGAVVGAVLRAVLGAVLVVLGGVWWWAVLRLVLAPERAGIVEGAVAAGGWGLSLLPVHVVSAAAAGVDSRRRWRLGRTRGAGTPTGPGVLTRASRRRRSGGGSGPS